MEQLKEAIRKNTQKVEAECKWVYKDRRHRALQNEFFRRLNIDQQVKKFSQMD